MYDFLFFFFFFFFFFFAFKELIEGGSFSLRIDLYLEMTCIMYGFPILY